MGKTSAIVLVLLFAYIADQAFAGNAMIKSFSKKCKTDEGASDDDVENLSNGIAPETKEGKCLAACMGKQYGLMKDDKINKSGFLSVVSMKLKEQAEKDKAGEVADACKDVTDDERCESAYKIWKCVEKEAKERDLALF
jgi:hypothetical protein